MYERVLHEAVEELKQEEFKQLFETQPQPSRITHPAHSETVVESDIEALIPNIYIESGSERLDIYRRVYHATEETGLQTIRDELRDRFGEYPVEVENLFALVGLRLTASRAGFPKVSLRGTTLILTLPDETSEWFYGADGQSDTPFQDIIRTIQKEPGNIRMKHEGKTITLECKLRHSTGAATRIAEAVERMNSLRAARDSEQSL